MNRREFATQVDEQLLKDIQSLADRESQKVQTLVEEALRDLLEKRRQEKPRDEVMSSFRRSLDRYSGLYEKLAK